MQTVEAPDEGVSTLRIPIARGLTRTPPWPWRSARPSPSQASRRWRSVRASLRCSSEARAGREPMVCGRLAPSTGLRRVAPECPLRSRLRTFTRKARAIPVAEGMFPVRRQYFPVLLSREFHPQSLAWAGVQRLGGRDGVQRHAGRIFEQVPPSRTRDPLIARVSRVRDQPSRCQTGN